MPEDPQQTQANTIAWSGLVKGRVQGSLLSCRDQAESPANRHQGLGTQYQRGPCGSADLRSARCHRQYAEVAGRGPAQGPGRQPATHPVSRSGPDRVRDQVLSARNGLLCSTVPARPLSLTSLPAILQELQQFIGRDRFFLPAAPASVFHLAIRQSARRYHDAMGKSD